MAALLVLLAALPPLWSTVRQRNAPPGAVIVDQLSLTDPNPDFVTRATQRLEAAGYAVDYVPGQAATVAFHKRLPRQGKRLVIFRSHAARIGELAADGVEVALGEDIALFSGEPIDLERYRIGAVPEPAATAVAAALAGADSGSGWGDAEPLDIDEVTRLMPVFYDPASGEMPFFGIRPDFVAQDFEGSFDGATILMMGCDGLRGPAMAEAFFARGAATFVSWDKPVSAAHTDAAMLEVLDRWLAQGQSLEGAVEETMDSLGPDPFYEGRLRLVGAEG